MTDDISAAKHYRQAIATVCEGFTLPDAARKVLETALWNPPTESATAPAEVGEAAISDALAAYLGHGGKFALWTSDQTEAMRAAMQVGCATLARQLAEAKVDTAKWKSLSDAAQIGINVQHKREVRLQSQLAAATKRLGEVEGLVGKWRDAAKQTANGPMFDGASEYAVSGTYSECADELEATLKEPK